MQNSKKSTQGAEAMTGQAAPALMPYPAYKPSGVTWLGDVPEHWEVQRFKYLLQERNNRSVDGDGQLLRVSQYTGVTQKRPVGDGGEQDTRAESLVGYKCVATNDLVMNIMLAWNGSMGVSQFPGITSPAYCVYRFKPSANPWYFHHLLRSPIYTARIKAISTGVVESRLRLYTDDLYNLESLLPPLSEQTAIARFLDHATQRIQRCICAKEKLIQLLEEQKQVIIHQAVTGQVDVRTGQPYPAYKNSGVAWLGKVPEHWEVSTVKRGYEIKLGKMLQPKLNSTDDVEVSYLKAKDVQWFSVQTASAAKMWASPGDIEQFSIASGDLLVCEGGEGGRCGMLTDKINSHIIQNSLHRVRSRNGNSNVFLQYTMRAVAEKGWFAALNNKATIAHFTYEKFGVLRIPLPSPLEQTKIAHFLDGTTEKIQKGVANLQREIALLHEYRNRLIADVVTGKLDVRAAEVSE